MSKRANPYLPGARAAPPAASPADELGRIEALELAVAELRDQVSKGAAALAALQATEREARAMYEQLVAKIRSKPLLAALLR